jgi:hypothetical protein
MSSKLPLPGARSAEASQPEDDMRLDLARQLAGRGVKADLAERLAADLVASWSSLTLEARRGAIAGVALASAVHQEHVDALRRSQQDLADIERMMAGFASELKKVDEAVKILATFVGRIRAQRATDPGRVVH